jgi:cell wall-associated NlpC family hydrolase
MTHRELDPRTHAFRPDLADLALKAFVSAPAYVEASIHQCVTGIAPLLLAPTDDAPRLSEIRYGEFVDYFESREDGFAWVQNRNDRTVGYIWEEGALNESISALMNRVTALHTFIYEEPDVRSGVWDRLTLGSYVSLNGDAGDFYPLAAGGFVFKKHVAPTDEAQTRDYVFTAGQLLNAPYLHGGRTPLGVDAAGLVQLALDMAGVDSPRFVDQQMDLFGHTLPCHWRDITWKRGDMLFFDDHVGLMTSAEYIISADMNMMQVIVEPLEDLVRRRGSIIAAGRP